MCSTRTPTSVRLTESAYWDYWDILTLYYNAVRATCKANRARATKSTYDQQVVDEFWGIFQRGIRGIRDELNELKELELERKDTKLRNINTFAIGFGLDVVFMSDVAYRDRQINVLFVGSAHARHIVDTIKTRKLGYGIRVARDL